MSQGLNQRLAVALDAVRLAGRVCQRVQQQLITGHTLHKDDRSPVTVADFASQAVVCAAIHAALPGDAIVAEEDAGELRGPQRDLANVITQHIQAGLDREVTADQVLDWIDHGNAPATPGSSYWTLDPIDGTKGFLRGGQYAVALAYIEAGRVVLGVLGCPNLPRDADPDPAATPANPGVLMWATEDHPTHQAPLFAPDAVGQPVRVSDLGDTAEARFCESVESGHSDQDSSSRIAAALGITAPPVRMDSQAKYAAVARGDAAIYLRLPTRPGYQECIWDHAAGAICVQQAGGRVSDITGQPLDFARGKTLSGNRGIVACADALHPAVIAAIDRA